MLFPSCRHRKTHCAYTGYFPDISHAVGCRWIDLCSILVKKTAIAFFYRLLISRSKPLKRSLMLTFILHGASVNCLFYVFNFQ